MIERFWAVVYDETQRSRLGIAQGCEYELRRFIDGAVDQLWSTGAVPEKVRKAEDEFRRFVEAMAKDALVKGYPELHEDTFAAAKSLFCPGFWPFC